MRLKLFAIIVLTMSMIASLQSFEWQDNGVPVRQGVNIEWSRAGATLEDGSVVYVWSDTKLGDRDVWAQRVDADGNIMWDNPVLVDGKVDRQEDPVVITTTDNHFIVAWIDFSQDISGDVFAQKISASGELQWSDGGVEVCVASAEQISLNIVPDGDGGAYIVWLDSRNSGGKDIYGMRVQSDGSMSWDANGIAIADNDGSQTGHTFWEDDQGGAVMAYVNSYNNNSDIFATRILPDGTKPWGNYIEVASSAAQEEKVKMAHLSDDKFALTWRERTAEGAVGVIKTRVIDNDGSMQDAQIVCDADGGQLNPRITSGTDGSFFIAWEDRRNHPNNSDIFVQKCNNAGVPQWADDGISVVEVDFIQKGQRLVSDGNGGCYVIWDDERAGGYPEVDIYVQHFNQNGDIQLEANGFTLCDAGSTQSKGLIRSGGNSIYVVWMDIRNGSIGLYYQVLENGSIQLAENGEQVFWGLSGDAVDHETFVKGSDTYIGWKDTRTGQEKIFIQKLNQNGEAMFAENGIPALNSDNKQTSFSMTKKSNGGTYFGVIQNINGEEHAYATALDHNGDHIWNESGVQLSDTGNSHLNIHSVEFNDGVLYGFSVMPGGLFDPSKLYVQYVVDGEIQWGDAGKCVLDIGNDVNLATIVDDILIVESEYNIYAQRIDENGDIYEGWPENGVVISDAPQIQKNPKAIRTENGVLVYWEDNRSGSDADIYGQMLNDDGTFDWDEDGIALVSLAQDQSSAMITTQDSEFYAVWTDFRNGVDEDISFQKFDVSDGSAVWSNNDFYAAHKDSAQVNPYITSLGNNHMIAWEDYMTADGSDIFIQSFNNEDGNILGTANTGDILCNALKKQYAPKINDMSGNYATVIWIDGRSSGKEEIKGIYAQKVAAYQVGNEDANGYNNTALEQNYPNPFNSNTRSAETKIRFSIPRDGKASISVYNVKGQKVATLVDKVMKAGKHEISWNGKSDSGKDITNGIYFYKLSTTDKTIAKKMVIMK